ncbi:MAG TPA: hypothetical protein V6D14_22660 [Coleofasciculaceae cyanobacterium]|jgi:hypothetical protein
MQVKPSSQLTPEERAELAKHVPKGIDVDRMADCFYFVYQNFNKIQEKYGKVEPWGVDAHEITSFLRSLDDYEIEIIKLKNKQIISVDRVLSKPCNKWRLAKALAQLEAGETALPIRVDAYRVEGIGCWYTVKDGINRTTAAKMIGLQEIEAEVVREIVLDCAAIRRKYSKYPKQRYWLEVLGIKKSLPGLIQLLWKIVISVKSEFDD